MNCAKASKSERNKGLSGRWFDSIEIVLYNSITNELLWKEKITTLEEQKVKLLEDMVQSAKKAIEESGIRNKKDIDLNIILFGKIILEAYLKDIKSTTKMEINSTTIQQILNSLLPYSTKEYILDANLKKMVGGNLVVNVENSNTLSFITKEKMGFLHGATPVALKMQLIIKEKDATNFHSTVKPLKLMKYLVKLVTKKGGIVMDPFAGSGTTCLASQESGMKFIGFEISEEYCKIANKRLEQGRLI